MFFDTTLAPLAVDFQLFCTERVNNQELRGNNPKCSKNRPAKGAREARPFLDKALCAAFCVTSG